MVYSQQRYITNTKINILPAYDTSTLRMADSRFFAIFFDRVVVLTTSI